MKARILIADDHPLFREGVCQWLNRQDDMLCCGEVADPAELQQAVRQHAPDALLLDLRFGRADGIALVKELLKEFPGLRVLLISQFDEAVYAERALKAGACGYVMKDQATEEVLTALRAVLAGDNYMSRRLTGVMVRRVRGRRSRSSAASLDLSSLTDRELQVFQLLGTGLSTRAIAGQIKVSFKTVETHRENIKRKLDLPNATQLIRAASLWTQGEGKAH